MLTQKFGLAVGGFKVMAPITYLFLLAQIRNQKAVTRVINLL